MSDPSRLPSKIGASRVSINVRPPKEEEGSLTLLPPTAGRRGDGKGEGGPQQFGRPIRE
jgi:hypothetical protein